MLQFRWLLNSLIYSFAIARVYLQKNNPFPGGIILEITCG